MCEQGKCYSPLGLLYSAVRDNYDPRSEGTISEETELEQVVRRATRLIQHQRQQGDGKSSSNGEVAGNSGAGEDTCSENWQDSNKETYPTTKISCARASSSRASITNAPTSHFSFMKPGYNRKPRQSYYRNNPPSRYSSYSRNNHSGWQSAAYSSYRASYQPWTGSKLEEEEEVAPAYTEEEDEITAKTEETQV